MRCFVSFGSNLGDSLAIVREAFDRLRQIPDTVFIASSALYRSTAVGPGVQDDYVNGVVELETSLDAHALLRALQAIENDAGRVRLERWGPRTLDLDLLLYADQSISTDTLEVPHPRMAQRNFVIAPLYDLAPCLSLPDGTAIAELHAALGSDGLQRLAERTDDN